MCASVTVCCTCYNDADAGHNVAGLHEDVGLFQRLTVLEKEFPGASVLVHKLGLLPPVSANPAGLSVIITVGYQRRYHRCFHNGLSKGHGLKSGI